MSDFAILGTPDNSKKRVKDEMSENLTSIGQALIRTIEEI
jgi:hypothetical protein